MTRLALARWPLAIGFVLGLFAIGAPASAQPLGTPRVRQDIHGNIVQTGNTALTCNPAAPASAGFTCAQALANRAANRRNNDYPMIFIDADNANGVPGAATTNQSSAASLSLPATGRVTWAGLYWMGQGTDANRGTVSFQGPGAAGYTTVTANQVLTGGTGNAFLAYADVTSTIRSAGAGMYWLGNMRVNVGSNSWGGWNLIVIYEDLTEPLRDLVVWDGNQSYQNAPGISLPLSGFVTPFSPLVNRVTDVGIFLGDGDVAQTDTLTLLGGTGGSQITTNLADTVANTTNDVANGTISTPYLPTQTTIPSYANALGYDLDVMRLTNRLPLGAQQATINALGSGNEVLFIGTITFSTNIYAPDLVSTKTAVDLNGAPLLPGDELEYTISFVNNGLDAALNTQLVDNLPAFTTLSASPNAITYDGTPLTAAADGDAGVYAMATNRVTVNINPPTGRVDTGNSHTVTIRVRLSDTIPSGTSLQNQAQFVYNGETLGNAVSYNSLSDGSSTAAGNNPTSDPIVTPPNLTFTETVSLTNDVNGMGDFDPGDTVTFTVTLTNVSGDAAQAVQLTDVFDLSTLELVNIATSVGAIASNTAPNLAVNVGNLSAGQSAVVTLTARIRRPFPVGVTSLSDQWAAAYTGYPAILSDDPSIAGANDPTVVSPITGTCACFVGNACFASGAADPGNSCGVCAPGTSQTSFSSQPDGNSCSVGPSAGTCHAGSCCTTCWNGAACVAGPTTCGVVCGDGQRVVTEECDDGNLIAGDGCDPTCTVEGGFSCAGVLPNVCTMDVAINAPANGSTTSNTTPTISGTGPAGSSLVVTEGATVVCMTTVSAGGTWSCTSVTLSLGLHTIVATTTGPGVGDLGRSVPDAFTVIDTCGDGTVQTGETCDDGNLANGDGCASTCNVEPGYSCVGAGPSTCTTGVIAITAPANGSRTSDTTPDISGTARANSSVTVFEGNTTLCMTTADGTGAWTCTSSVLTLGAHTIRATSTGPNAGDHGLSTDDTFTVVAPCGDGVVAGAELCDDGNTAAGDGCDASCNVEAGYSCAGAGPSTCTTGVIAITAPMNGSSTTDATPDISGTAKPGSTVVVFEGGTQLCTTTASGSGAWTCTSSTLTLGAHTVYATSTGPNPGDHGLSTDDTFTVIAAASCGNGTVGTGETCDDGNVVAGDGCDASCNVEAGYSCVGAGPSTCTTGVIAITAPANGSTTTNTTPTITGTARGGSTVSVYEGGTLLCSAVAAASGAWSCVSSTLPLGAHTIRARSVGPNPGDNGLSTDDTFTVVAPVAQLPPVILVPADGGVVSTQRPLILGRGEPGASITVHEGATSICTTTVDPSGTWSCTPTSDLALGVHTIVADQSKAGVMLQSLPVTFTIDLGAFASPTLVTPPPGSVIGITRPTLTGTAVPGSTVTVSEGSTTICSGVTSASGVWSCVPTSPLSEGPHPLDLTSTLGVQTSTGGPDTITVDLTAPAIDIVVPTVGATVTDTTPAISGTTEANAKVKVYEGATLLCSTTADATGAWSCSPSTALADGTHAVLATATDAAGNVSVPDTTSFVIDTTGPAVVITGPSEGAVLRSTTPVITGTSEPGSTVTVTEGATTICTAVTSASGVWSCVPTSPLSSGPHTVTATATDPAGNPGPTDTQSFTIDTTAISTPILTGPLMTVMNSMPMLTGTSDPNVTVTVTNATGGTVCVAIADASGNWSCTPTSPLAEGPNVLTLVATSGALTSAPGTGTVTVDTMAPQPPTITRPGSAPTPNTRPTIGGTAEPHTTVTVRGPGNTVICTARVDASGNWSCVPTTPLPEGPTAITATSTDDAGNESTPANGTINVDTTAPSITITAPVNGSTIRDTTPTVGGTTEPGADVTVTDDAGFFVCSATAAADGTWSCDVASPLVDGPHTLRATATDDAGNTSAPASTVFIVDTSTPATPGGLSGGALCSVDASGRSNATPVLVGLAIAVLGLRRARRRNGGAR